MNRILALQGLSGTAVSSEVIAQSDQSNYCSSETTACSTQSSFCKALNEQAW